MDFKLCRICCENDGVWSVFDDKLKISAKIMYCCPNIKIKENDDLPSHICIECERQLTVCYQFVLKCEEMDRKLWSQALELTIPSVYNEDACSPKTEMKTEHDHSDDNLFNGHDSHDDITLNQLKQNQEITPESVNIPSIKACYKKRIKAKKQTCTCTVCGRRCANPSSLLIHMRSHSDDKPFQCSSCDKKYKDSGGVKRHMERVHFRLERQRDFICEHCGKGFFTKNSVKIHMRTHTGETPYICPFCPARFNQIGTLLRHKKRHSGEKSQECLTCKKRFCTKEQLKTHLVAHTNNKNYSCQLCTAKFKYQNNLKKHVRQHSEPDSFICNYCGRTFNVKGNLKLHIDRQHSAKSGFCKVCSKNVSNIENHTWKHTGQRPLKCELCASGFYELKALARHMNFKHMKTERYKCSFAGCAMGFPSKPMLDFHIVKLHETHIPYPCDRCSRGFYRKNDLSRHKLGTHKEKLTY